MTTDNHQDNTNNKSEGIDAADNKASIVNPEPAIAAAAVAEKNAMKDNAMKTNESDQGISDNMTTSKVKNASEFGKVAVVYGGSSNERSVSLDSGAAVLSALQNQGVDATHFDPKHQDVTELR